MWGEHLTNIVIDPITNHLFILDRDTTQIHVLSYENGNFSLVRSSALGQFFQPIAEGEFLSISHSYDTLFLSSPSNNTFHTYMIAYNHEGTPSITFGSNNLLESARGTVRKGYIVSDRLHLLTTDGWHLYTYNGSSLSYVHEQQIGSSLADTQEVVYDSAFAHGWVIEEDSAMCISPFDIISGVPDPLRRLDLTAGSHTGGSIGIDAGELSGDDRFFLTEDSTDSMTCRKGD